MKPLDRLSEYLGAVERRMRLLVVTRGAAVTAAAALILTVLAVLMANHFSFSNGSVIGARFVLFIGLALALAAALIVPVIRLNRRHAARAAESRYPQFQERLLTFTERLEQNPGDPFLPLLADDTLAVASQAAPQRVAKNSWLLSFSSLAVLCAAALIWLGVAGGGFLGYGTSLLWGGIPKGNMKPFYSIQVEPGNLTVRKRADQMITATLLGFNSPRVRFLAKYSSASKWEEAEMRSSPSSSSYQFLIVGVPESLEYYVDAGGVHSPTYKLNVVDLPSVKNLKVTYHYPSWSGMKDMVENPGGDLRAVEGTTADVVIETDRPLANGAILLDDGSKLPLRQTPNGLMATVPITKDDQYHIAAVEGGEDVRLTDDYLIEAQKYQPPDVKVTRPGHDYKATPIEEVTVSVEAKQDFGLQGVDLHYSVNGSPEKVVPLLQNKGAKTASGSAVLSMEDLKVQPGDMVSVYATAKDARKTSTTDMFFIEMQPFERNYTQTGDGGGGGGGGGGDDDMGQQGKISERQKEIITATWNELKGRGARGTEQENAQFLSEVQSKLRDQAKSLSDRMKARQLEDAGDSFKSFVTDMDQAVSFMNPASGELKGAKWESALEPEQKALTYLLRAEATMRDIQVSFGQRGGGGGGGGASGATRDLQGLFDLELDTEKNQYEGARRTQTADERQKAVDEALQKLDQLAKRQQDLAEQQKKGQLTPEQRWQQEQLRRDAEKLKQELAQAAGMQQQQQLSRDQGQQSQQGGQPGQSGQQSGGQQSGQQSGGQQSGQMSQGGQPGQQQGQPGQQQQRGQQNAQGQQSQQQQLSQMGQRFGDQRTLENTLNDLQKAIDNMSKAASSQQAGTPQGEADARRALAALQDAQQGLSGVRSSQSKNQVEDLLNQAENLAKKQEDIEGQMRKAYGPQSQQMAGQPGRQRDEQIATQKDGEVADLKKLESGMQAAARDEASSQRAASAKMREALSEIQQMEMERDMERNAQYIRKGLGEYVVMSESNFTQGLDTVRDKLKEVQQALGTPGKDGKNPGEDKAVQQSLASLENLRQMFQPGSGQAGQQQGLQRGQNGQQPGQGQQAGQKGQPGGQPGQQQGGQQNGQQAGPGGQQPGQGNQPGQGGQQPGQMGQPNGRGSQAGGNSQGQGPGGGWNTNGNGGGNYLGPNGAVNPQSPDYQAQYHQTMQNLMQLEQQMKGDPSTAKDIGALIQQLRQLDPYQYSNDPLLAQRIQAAVVGSMEQVEMELRRRVEENTGGDVRSPGNEVVPPGYSGATADYFKRLSKSTTTGKQQ